MIKKSILQREIKRKKLYKKYLFKQINIINKLKKKNSLKINNILLKKLRKIPRNSFLIRQRNRCWKTGRGRGYLKFFGLCRNVFRELALNGFLPGVIKSSW